MLAIRRLWAPALEVAVAIATVALFVFTCSYIRVQPTDRLGQISGLASLALRVFLFGLVIVASLIVASRVRGGRWFEMTKRLSCAAISGIVGGMLAGGAVVALRGTPWGFNGLGGDIGVLAARADALARGESLPPLYPPLSIHILRIYADVMGLSTAFAIKHLQILGTAALGPVAYLSWRLLFRPGWALAIGTVAMLPLVEPYKPYPNLVLIAFLPLSIYFLDVLRNVGERTTREIASASVALGLVFGVLCLLYSGWFQWAAPGLFVATLVLFPWKRAPRKGLLFLALAAVAFALIAGRYVVGLFAPAARVVDDYVYFDVKTEPMYFAIWRGDAPGPIGAWPPLGEIGGVGIYSVLLFAALAAAVALGPRTTLVITACATMTGAWLMRFFFARDLWETKLVQLYPRTTPLIDCCLLVLAGFVVYSIVQRASAEGPWRGRAAQIGAVCGLLLLFASAGSATADRYMPARTEPASAGQFAFVAHYAKWTMLKRATARPMLWVRRFR